MNKQRTTPRRWRELGITAKFASAFGMLLALMALVSLTSYLALTAVRRQTEAAIVTSMETQRLVLEMDAGLQRARRLERDLFLRWPAVGFSQALETFSRQHDEEIAQVMARSASLQGLISGSDVSDALRESEVSLNFYLSAADRNATTFDEAIELVTELATDETGAQARLERNSELLRDMLQLADDPTLMVLYREMQSFEKDYLVTRQRPYMQSAFNVAGPLREAISASSGFDEADQAQVLVFLDDYLAVAEEILLLDVEIGHKLNEFDLQAEAIDPISEELIGLANAETQRAREQITRTSRLATTLLAVAILAAVTLAIVIALALNNSVTRNVVRLTNTASELRDGNLEVRAQIDSGDELGQLADSFNAMATRIKTLVDTLEQKVEERTADLRASQEYARNIIDSSLDPIIAVDRERRVVEFNTAAQDTFGYRPEEILGQNADVLYADGQEGSEIHRKTIEEGRCIREVMNKRKNGEVFPAFLSSSLLHDARGELVGVMGVSRDITERVRAESELRKHQEHLEELVEERTVELRASEERYRTLFDGVPVGLYRTTPAGQIVDANLALVQMMGYPTREDFLVANPVSFYVDPGERVRWQALMEREGVVRDFEIQMYKYDGALFWVNNSARAVRDEGGRVLYYEGSLEDITERKQAEAELGKYREHLEDLVEERTAELRESEERYRTLFDGVPVGLYRTTPEGPIVDVNLAMVHMLGYPSREEFLALESTASLYVNPEERAQAGAVLDQDGVVRDFETQMYKYDGSVIWVSQTARAVRDEQGQVLYHEGSLEDITRRKEFEGEIRRQKDYFEALFINSPTAVVTADLDANVVSWNPMAEKLFGYSQEEAIGKTLDDLVANDPRVRQEALNYSDQAITKGRVQATTKRTRKDGSLVDVEVLALPVIVAGERVGFIAIYHDISELQEARRAAEAANQAKSAFLASMSHELRTPLNAILGFAQLMDRDPNLSAEQQENMTIINRSGEHLLALINDVLEMSKIEAGRVTLEEKSFDLYRLLDGLEEMFRLRAEDKGLALRFERSENVPQHVRTDEGKLRQVLSNLLGNAVKFTQEGGVTLRVGSSEESFVSPLPTSHTLLQFEVEDTGPGLAPEELAAVFDPFVQATSKQRSQEGTGLGLSISQQFVRLMGGDLSLSSEMGRGSLFKFDVQVGLVEEAEVQEAQARRRVLGLAPDQPVCRLLVAEDKDTNRRLLVKLLESLGPSTGSGPGFEVREAINGQETIEMWEHWEPHLIWMDMRMPVVDGYQATKHIKTEMRNRKSEIQTVIIALTASAFEEDREKVLSQGCDDFVRKPFREDEIYEMLTKYLGVCFVYEDEVAQTTPVQPREAAAPLGDVLTPDALAALPPNWLADLQEATIKADLSLILVLIDQISEENPALAHALGDLAHDYQYKRILTSIEQAGGQR